jgi:protein-S-isoprenylcysteine O-methyltransferase Ste14
VERSTFVLAATASLALLLWQWRPIAQPTIWSVADPLARFALQAVFWLGWAMLLISTFLINHFELFGLRQVFARWRGLAIPAPVFRTPLFYRHVRHPTYLGFILAFWATPLMSAGHLLFAIGTTESRSACCFRGEAREEGGDLPVNNRRNRAALVQP